MYVIFSWYLIVLYNRIYYLLILCSLRMGVHPYVPLLNLSLYFKWFSLYGIIFYIDKEQNDTGIFFYILENIHLIRFYYNYVKLKSYNNFFIMIACCVITSSPRCVSNVPSFTTLQFASRPSVRKFFTFTHPHPPSFCKPTSPLTSPRISCH